MTLATHVTENTNANSFYISAITTKQLKRVAYFNLTTVSDNKIHNNNNNKKLNNKLSKKSKQVLVKKRAEMRVKSSIKFNKS